jgi:putative FmdB family regulatory protein
MPTYEYECVDCGRILEAFQSMSAKPLRSIKTDCSDCANKAKVKRLIGSGAAVLFKGGGFYETDYRSESYKKAAKAEKESATASTEKAADKSADKSTDAKKDSKSSESAKDNGKATKPDSKRNSKKSK